MIVIGEKINATNKLVAGAIASRDVEYISKLAISQADNGADFIDVNAGNTDETGGSNITGMEWLVEVVQSATDKPLTIDSDDVNVIEAALRKYKGSKLIINSVTAESFRLEPVGKIAVEWNAGVVALAMGENGIPDNVEDRLAACEKIITYLTGIGMSEENIYFDPLVLPISVDSSQGLVTLNTIKEIKVRYSSARTVMGLSNISYGLPNRKIINRTFLTMAAYAGLDAAILDPLDARIMGLVKTADMLTGKDPSCRKYLRAHRKGIIVG
jgi:cobalamin-dependent methionine synthase I